MARAYRTDTVQGIYEAVEADAAVRAEFPDRRLILDKSTPKARARQLQFRAVGDFPVLSVSTGTNDGGVLFGVQTYGDEGGGGAGVPDDVDRTAEYELLVAYAPDRADDAERDRIETLILAAIAAAGEAGALDPSVAGARFRRQRGTGTLGDAPDGPKVRTSRITLTVAHQLEATDVLPDEEEGG